MIADSAGRGDGGEVVSPSSTCAVVFRRGQCARRRHLGIVLEFAGENGVEQRSLLRLQGDEAAEDVEEIDEVAGVLVRPVLRLDVAKRRGLASVTDDGARAVALPVETPRTRFRRSG